MIGVRVLESNKLLRLVFGHDATDIVCNQRVNRFDAVHCPWEKCSVASIEIQALNSISHETCRKKTRRSLEFPLRSKQLNCSSILYQLPCFTMGSAHFRSTNTNGERRRRGHFDCCSAVVRIYYALQIDNAASTVAQSLSLRLASKMQTNAPTNIACHINWNYKF